MPPAMPMNRVNPPQDDIEMFCAAANRGDIEVVRSYLDQYGKAIVDTRDNIQARAITWAAFSGHTDVVQLLVERGADINAGGTDDKPALTWAITGGKSDVVSYLLHAGASLDTADRSGTTPRQYAENCYSDDIKAIVGGRIEQMKEHERLNGEKAKEEAAKAVSATRLENLKKHNPPKLKR